MKLGTSSGHKFTLRTTLSIAECRQRRLDEFYDKHGHWHHAVSDKSLIGQEDGRDFIIYPSIYYFNSGRSRSWTSYYSIGNSRYWATNRFCRIRFRGSAGGATLTGVYGYEKDAQMLLGMVFLACMAFTFGPLFIIGGIILLFQDLAAFWMVAMGLALIATLIVILRGDADDRAIPREGNQIKRYLVRVLEAEETKAARTVAPVQR